MNYFIYFTSGALFLLTTIQYRNWLKIVLHALSVVIQRLLQWMEECNHEGLMCLWVSPTYPLTLIFKPELAEVREDSFSRPFTIHLRYYIKATITSLKPTQKSHIDPVNGPARSKHLWYSSLHRSPFGFCDSHGFIPCRWCFFFGFRCCSLACFVSFLFLFFSLPHSCDIPLVLEVFLSPVAASLSRALVSATGPGREGYSLWWPIRRGPARKGYLLSGREICHFGL